MKLNPELTVFDTAMDQILKADPKAVKAAMEADKAATQRSGRLRNSLPLRAALQAVRVSE